MHILNAKGITAEQLQQQLLTGDRVVVFQYCYSVIIFTSLQPSDFYLIRQGESGFSKGILYSAISFFAGWWGFPWGPIRTIQSFITNFGGGRDVTQEVRDTLEQSFLTDPVYRQQEVGANPASAVRLSRWSLLLGVLSIVVGPLTFLPGILVGHLAMRKLKYLPEVRQKGIALIGLLLSYAMFLFYLALFVAGIVSVIQKSEEDLQRSSQHSSSEVPPGLAEEEDPTYLDLE